MTVSNFIKASALTISVFAASTSTLHARPLTPAEQSVCSSLKACLDIVRRHDGSEFDYTALEAEFRRFGPTGKTALFGLLESDAGQKIIKRVPMRRSGNVEDLDGALLLLASDKSRFMTGSVIPVDGGHLVSGL